MEFQTLCFVSRRNLFTLAGGGKDRYYNYNYLCIVVAI